MTARADGLRKLLADPPPIRPPDDADRDPRWWDRYGNCKGTDPGVFHPEKGQDATAAKRVCAPCPVREWCLEWAMATNEPHGVWGGMSERGRKKLRKEREAAAKAARAGRIVA